MKDSREKLIRNALIDAKNKGIKIWPGAVFDWTNRPSHLKFEKFEIPGPSGNLPSACNAIGALELALGKTRDDNISYTQKICDYLEIGTYWLYRFHIGFDQGRQLFIRKVDNRTKEAKEIPCIVSKFGSDLRKEFVK